MVKRNELNVRQKRVYDACNDGWYLGGKYQASFDNHSRTFYADSLSLLFRDVDSWFRSHELHHGDAHILVKCVQAL